MLETRESRQQGAVAAWVFVFALLTFLPATLNDFVSLDDSLYVYDNAIVRAGLTPSGIAAVFAGPQCNFYHPLTMLSLMLDRSLWGLNPLGFHFTNVLAHALTAALLFVTLVQMTGMRWRSAFVAAIFAVHPLRVESVAWVAERKDVLSAFFFVLTLWTYARFAREPENRRRYWSMVAIFATGLLCKTSLVTLPFLLLLLDYWPLGRWSDEKKRSPRDGWIGTLGRRVAEKWPLFVLAIGASAVSVVAQKTGVIPYEDFPFGSRVQNAIVAYGIYIAQTFVPVGLAVNYPFLGPPPAGLLGLCASLLLGVTIAAVIWRRKLPYFFVGWFWYLGVLVPMVGLVQVGVFAHADRFTYLPQIGLLIALTWGLADLMLRGRVPTFAVTIAAVAVLLASAAATVRQIGFWSDSETLFRHALAVTNDNGLAEASLGAALLERRKAGVLVPEAVTPERRAEAVARFREAVRLLPKHADVHLNLGLTLADMGPASREEAIAELRTALATMGFYAPAHLKLGLLLAERGEADAALEEVGTSVRLDPRNLSARNNFGSLLRRQGRLPEAIEQFRLALEQEPNFAEAHNNLGIALYQVGRPAEAIAEFHEAMRIDPTDERARKNLDLLRSGDAR